jgi:hypothetical protein
MAFVGFIFPIPKVPTPPLFPVSHFCPSSIFVRTEFYFLNTNFQKKIGRCSANFPT